MVYISKKALDISKLGQINNEIVILETNIKFRTSKVIKFTSRIIGSLNGCLGCLELRSDPSFSKTLEYQRIIRYIDEFVEYYEDENMKDFLSIKSASHLTFLVSIRAEIILTSSFDAENLFKITNEFIDDMVKEFNEEIRINAEDTLRLKQLQEKRKIFK
jgi:hypothetical protein